MKDIHRTLLSLICVCMSFAASAQLTTEWSKTINPPQSPNGDTEIFDMKVESPNSIYAVGSFRRTVNFGGGYVLTSNTWNGGGNADGFLMNMDANGNTNWAVKIATDDNPGEGLNMEIVGGHLYIQSQDADNDFDYYPLVEKRTLSGSLVWARTVTSTNSYWVRGFDVDNSGNSYSVYELGINSITYMRKYSSTGGTSSTHTLYNSHTYEVNDIAADGAGNYYIVGLTQPASYNRGLLIAKFNSSGTKLWENVYGGTGDQETYGYSIEIDDNDNIYVCGRFNKTVNIGGFTVSTGSGSGGTAHNFVAKFNSSGAGLWTINAGSNSTGGHEIVLNRAEDGLIVVAGGNVHTMDLNGNLKHQVGLAGEDMQGIGPGFDLEFYLGGRFLNSGYYTAHYRKVNCIAPAIQVSADYGLCVGTPTVVGANGDIVDWYDEHNNLLQSQSMTYPFTVDSTTILIGRLEDSIGCPGYDTVVVTGWPNPVYYDTVTICADETYYAGGANQNSPGDYFDILTSQHGCDSTVWTHLIVNPVPAVQSVTVNGPTTFCELEVSLSTDSLAGYQWQLNGAPIPGANDPVYFPVTSGFYNVDVFDTNGCSTVSNFATVTVYDAPDTPMVTPSGFIDICEGDTIVLTSSSAVNNTWSTGATSQTISVTQTGVYSVSVTNANNCTRVSNEVDITSNPLAPIPTISFGGNVMMSSSTSNNQWYLNGSPLPGQTGQFYQPLVSGNYMVAVDNGVGCLSFSTPYNFQCLVVAGFTASSLNVCMGDSVWFTNTTQNANVYTWKENGNTFSNQLNPIRQFNTAGNFAIDLIVSDNGSCVDTFSMQITVHAPPSLPNITVNGNTTFCEGEFVALTSAAANSYLWSDGSSNQTLVVTTSGNWSVTVSDAFGCSTGSLPVSTTMNPGPPVPTIVEFGGTLGSSATTGNQWFFNGALIPGANGQFYTFSQGGTFHVEVTDLNGCTSASLPYNTYCSTLTSGFTISTTSICAGDLVSITNTSSGANDYDLYLNNNWIGDSPDTSFYINEGGMMEVKLLASNDGCTDTATTMVESNYPEPQMTTTNVSTIGGSDGTSTAVASGQFQAPVSYIWGTVPPQTTATATGLAEGNYGVTLTDAMGCSATGAATIIFECEVPEALHTTKLKPTSARLHWNAMPSSHHYEIRGRRIGVATWLYLPIAAGAPNWKDALGLTNNTSYEWQIRSSCNAGETVWSPWSTLDTFVTGCYITDSTWTDPVTNSGARLNWIKGDGSEGYEIKGRKIGGSLATILVGGGNVTSRDVFGLLPATTYEWVVRSWCDQNGNKKSDFTSFRQFTTLSSNSRTAGFQENLVEIYPNPNEGQAQIQLQLKQDLSTSVMIYNSQGSLVTEAFSQQKLQAGLHQIKIDLSDESGTIFFVKVSLGNEIRTLTILKQ